MANILLGCDKNEITTDKQNQKKIANILKKAGHTVEILNVGPNHTQTAMQKKSSKGKIAIYLVNGADLQTYRDFYDGVTKGYYHVKYCYFGLQGYINSKTCSCNGAKTVKLKRAHDDGSPVSYTKELVGMTTAQVCKKYKSAIAYACGSTAKELGDNLVKVIGGGSNSNSSPSSSSPIRDALKEVLYGWKDQVECYLRDDTIHIHKIRSPTAARLSLVEDENVLYDSIHVSDVNPKTVNTLIVKFNKSEFVLKDDDLIKRFGKVKKTITVNNKTEKAAIKKAYEEWNKLQKDNGRELECKVDGDPKWRIGEWVRVYIPSFCLNGYMYITRVSHSDDNDWECSLTLKDYPPDLSEKPSDNDNSGDG